MTEEFNQFIEKFSTVIQKVREATAYLAEDVAEEDLDETERLNSDTLIDNLAQYFSVGLIVEEFLRLCKEGDVLQDRDIGDTNNRQDYKEINKRDEPCGLSFEHYSFRDTIEDSMRNMIVILRDDLLNEEEEPVFSGEELSVLAKGRYLFIYSYLGAVYNQMTPYETGAVFKGLCNLEDIQDGVHPYDQEQTVLDKENSVFDNYFAKHDFNKNSYLITIAPTSILKRVRQTYQEPEPLKASQAVSHSLN